MIDNPSFTTVIHAAAAKIAPSLYDVPDPARVLGLSVSPWSHLIDWQKAKAGGVQFAIIKFMDGTAVVPYAEANYKAARDAGIIVGGYTWLYRSANISAGAQARAFCNFIKDHPCDIRPCVDFEWTKWGGRDSNPTWSDLYGFGVPFRDNYGKFPMIYTAPGYWSQYGNSSREWLDYPLYQAQYRVSTPLAMQPWGNDYKFWQFSAVGNSAFYGYPKDGEKEAELNYWNGTLDTLKAWCGLSDTPTVPLPVPATLEQRMDKFEARLNAVEGRLAEMEGGK